MHGRTDVHTRHEIGSVTLPLQGQSVKAHVEVHGDVKEPSHKLLWDLLSRRLVRRVYVQKVAALCAPICTLCYDAMTARRHRRVSAASRRVDAFEYA